MNFDKWDADKSALEALKKHELFQNKLLPDIHDGIVFPAIRSAKIDFYFLGRKLFSFDGTSFRTNEKFAFVIQHDRNGEVTESQLTSGSIVSSFFDGYDGIKRNIALYTQPESLGIYELCKQYSFARRNATDCVVLDIERSFIALENPEESDRVDLVLLRQSTAELMFVEAKCYTNRELWFTGGVTPRVITQIERYNAQINAMYESIKAGYASYINIMNKLLDLKLEPPQAVVRAVRLLVFGYSNDQKEEIASLARAFHHDFNIPVIARGGLTGISSDAIGKKWWQTRSSMK